MITNILMTKKWYTGRYMAKNDCKSLQPVFPTANLAIRREVFDEIGAFDTTCNISGEDADLCIRVSKTKWEIFFEKRAIVRHKYRTSLRGLLKQWYSYGMSQPYIFKKYAPQGLEICYPDKKSTLDWSSLRFNKICGIPVGMHILIFVTPFHIFNIILIFALLAAILGAHILSMALLGGWLLGHLCLSGEDFFRNVILKKNTRWFVYSFFRYLLNWAHVMGSFLEGIKIGVLYFGVTRERTPA